ncbi:hypothetical protein HYI36_20285 [Bacillus sp. Gen3]|nr:hypothetical protein [Bacillus sp. Gen3]
MLLTQAIHATLNGHTVVSTIGRRYTAEELQPKMLGEHAAVFNDVGMTAEERKGEWRVE